LYSSSNIVIGFKLTDIQRTGIAVHMGEIRNAYKILLKILNVADHSEDLGVYEMIILKQILNGFGVGCILLAYDTGKLLVLINT
jgi:hypothetical protein